MASNPQGELRALRYGVITTPARQPTPQRLRTLADAVAQLLDELHPAAVAIERLYFSTNVKTAMGEGEGRGLVLCVRLGGSAPAGGFSSRQVKLTVANSGRADKRQVQTMVKLLLRLPTLPQPDDAADALALAICGQRAHTTKSRLEL